MPVYLCQVKGADKVRLVKAPTAAQARDHIVSAETLSAEEMSDLMEKDPELKVEKAGETTPAAKDPPSDPKDPASYAPGGALHGTPLPDDLTPPPPPPPPPAPAAGEKEGGKPK